MIKLDTILLDIVESENHAIIYLNRPDQLNALNYKLAADFNSALDVIIKNGTARSIIIIGNGKAFCAGGDLMAFKKEKNLEEFIVKLATLFHGAIKKLKNLDAPSVAAINGPCFGVGLSLACACDIRICSEDARFGVAFTSVGLSPDSSLTFHLPKIVGLPLANEMALLNRILNAEDAKICNLVTQVISAEKSLLDEAKSIAIKLSNGPTKALGSTKRLFTQSFSNNLEEQLNKEILNAKFNAAMDDFREGINSFLEKRKPSFKGK